MKQNHMVNGLLMTVCSLPAARAITAPPPAATFKPVKEIASEEEKEE